MNTAARTHADVRIRRDVRTSGLVPWLIISAWAFAGLALFALFARISFSARVDSDGANSALQAWDLVHGHLRLHGWYLGDVTFYFFELPIIGVMQLLFGLGATSSHLASALVLAIVAGLGIALAVRGSRGPAAVARAAVVVAVLAVPLLSSPGQWLGLEEPDHIGSSVFLLVAALLVDRGYRWRYAPPVLAVVLCAGQFSDLTIRYTAVPAIAVACAYRAIASRRVRSADAGFAVAAIVSVPVESALRGWLSAVGGFTMSPPRTGLSSPGLWPRHLSIVWLGVRALFGQTEQPGALLGLVGPYVLGTVCLAGAIVGFARVIWTWRRASRAEHVLVLAIVFNISVWLVSDMPIPGGQREIAMVLPCGAILAARACVPETLTGAKRNWAVPALMIGLAVTPLAVAAAQPPYAQHEATLGAWLEEHHLTDGIGGYWDASITTLVSGDRVRIREVELLRTTGPPGIGIHSTKWESDSLLFNPARYDATFAVAEIPGKSLFTYPASEWEAFFGKPAHVYEVDGVWLILVYQRNLLASLAPIIP